MNKCIGGSWIVQTWENATARPRANLGERRRTTSSLPPLLLVFASGVRVLVSLEHNASSLIGAAHVDCSQLVGGRGQRRVLREAFVRVDCECERRPVKIGPPPHHLFPLRFSLSRRATRLSSRPCQAEARSSIREMLVGRASYQSSYGLLRIAKYLT